AAGNSEIEQTYVVSTTADRFNSSLPGIGPFEVKRLVLAEGKDSPGQEVIFFPVFDQEDARRTLVHMDPAANTRPIRTILGILPTLDGGKKNAHIEDRFGNVIVETGGKIFFAVADHGMGG